jgi:hypothetical protein
MNERKGIPLYADLLEKRPPLEALEAAPRKVADLVRGWDERRWSLTYAPGKWSAAQIVLHLAQDEIGWSNRIRFLLAVPDFVIQPFDGADWVARESPADGRAALEAFAALRRLDLRLYRGITPAEAKRSFPHPEFGEISIGWILGTLAGHDLHHLRHLKAIAEAPARRTRRR